MPDNGIRFVEECAGFFDLGSVRSVQQFRRPDSINPRLLFHVCTSAGEWFLKAFDESSALAEEVRFIAGYAARLSARDLAPALRSSPNGEQLARAVLAGRTYRVLCWPWIGGKRCEPDGWTEDYLTQVGRLLAAMHRATAGWRPDFRRVAWNYSVSANQAVGRIKSWSLLLADDLAFLARIAAKVAEGLSKLDVGQEVVIHGDPWYGNLLLCDGRLMAVDFTACGFGPRAGDIAVWFYWTVYRFGLDGWREPFDAVLSGYEALGPLDRREKLVIPHLACLRHLWFLVEEVEERMAIAPKDREAVTFYIRDHVSAIRTIAGA
jgi:Ser/Thr protein kinase RdoA (MazF antagonist)